MASRCRSSSREPASARCPSCWPATATTVSTVARRTASHGRPRPGLASAGRRRGTHERGEHRPGKHRETAARRTKTMTMQPSMRGPCDSAGGPARLYRSSVSAGADDCGADHGQVAEAPPGTDARDRLAVVGRAVPRRSPRSPARCGPGQSTSPTPIIAAGDDRFPQLPPPAGATTATTGRRNRNPIGRAPSVGVVIEIVELARHTGQA